MNKSRRTVFNTLALVLCLIGLEQTYGQKETKTFNETFKTEKDAVLNIDTSHTDIEFETWDKDEVSVAAVIQIEGATKEEVQRYFENESFEILGNSKKVTVKTTGGNQWFFGDADVDFHFEMPEMPHMNGVEMAMEIMELPEMAEMPELPRAPVPHFDYQAYKEDKEGYMEAWQNEFEKSFGSDYQKKMEAWGERMEKKQEALSKRMEKRTREREKLMEEREKLMEERVAKREKRMEEAQKLREEQVEKRINQTRSIHISQNGSEDPNVFYFSSGGKNKNFKVKKTIKIKMPKGMKIKMNVRHGDVKLADNVWHMDAKLSHSSLWAASIDGDRTTIETSYSPVNVDRWYLGNLQANYSENVTLKEVFDIRLNSTSSNVSIDKLIKKAFVKNDFGQLKISSVTKDFTELDITLKNSELDLNIPKVAFDIYVNGTSSSFSGPANVMLDRTENHNNVIHKGYHIKKNDGPSIVINAIYSEVQVQ